MSSDDGAERSAAILEQEEQRIGILRQLADDAYSWASCTFKEYVALNPGAQPEDYVNRLMVTYINPNRGPDERRVIRNRLIELVKGDAL